VLNTLTWAYLGGFTGSNPPNEFVTVEKPNLVENRTKFSAKTPDTPNLQKCFQARPMLTPLD